MERRVAVFVGSLRAASWSRKVAQALMALAPHSLQPEMVEIGPFLHMVEGHGQGGFALRLCAQGNIDTI